MESTLAAPKVIVVDPTSCRVNIVQARTIVRNMAPDVLTLPLAQRKALRTIMSSDDYRRALTGEHGWQRDRANEFARALAVRKMWMARRVIVREPSAFSVHPGEQVLCDQDGGRPLLFRSEGKAWRYFRREATAYGMDPKRAALTRSFTVRPPSRSDLRQAGILRD